jgi:hypothetical protein
LRYWSLEQERVDARIAHLRRLRHRSDAETTVGTLKRPLERCFDRRPEIGYSRVMKRRVRSENSLRRMASRGFRGFPVATIALYGPDNVRASKVAVGIILGKDEGPVEMRRWYSDEDVRSDAEIGLEIIEFIRSHDVRSVALGDRIIGCPHEEGKDYPEGEVCPQCPFWANRDRFTHEIIQ